MCFRCRVQQPVYAADLAVQGSTLFYARAFGTPVHPHTRPHSTCTVQRRVEIWAALMETRTGTENCHVSFFQAGGQQGDGVALTLAAECGIFPVDASSIERLLVTCTWKISA